MQALSCFKNRTFAAAAVAVLCFATTAVPAQEVVGDHPLAGDDRPAGVPADYVITPFGYFHPSCVRTLPSGTTLLQDGRALHADGTVERPPQACAYPHYQPAIGNKTNPTINGWIEDIDTTTTTSYGELTSTFTVPTAPTTQTNQTDYFFPGFQDTKATGSDISILQPVLTWTGKGPWNISSWNCCLSGTANQSTPVNVNVGDVIYGSITSECSVGSASCAKWNVLSEDKTTGKSTTLANTPSDGQTWNWGFGAVLEAYSVSSCAQLPAADSITFNTTLYTDGLVAITTPGWKGELDATSPPSCSYSQTVTVSAEELKY